MRPRRGHAVARARGPRVLAMLDMPSWVSLLGLLDECPVLPAALTATLEARIGAVSPTAFDFISTTGQIGEVRAFMGRLPRPGRLTCNSRVRGGDRHTRNADPVAPVGRSSLRPSSTGERLVTHRHQEIDTASRVTSCAAAGRPMASPSGDPDERGSDVRHMAILLHCAVCSGLCRGGGGHSLGKRPGRSVVIVLTVAGLSWRFPRAATSRGIRFPSRCSRRSRLSATG